MAAVVKAPEAALVIKVQNGAENPAEFAALQSVLRDLPGAILITETLSRRDIYALEAACDCFVSLHRSEGFGLAIAESMYLGKPAIATDWSASAEFVNAALNNCVHFVRNSRGSVITPRMAEAARVAGLDR